MSAYVVDRQTIDAAVIAFQELFDRPDNTLPPFPNDARTKLGRDLWTMNMHAVGDRYAHNGAMMAEMAGYQADIDAYVFRFPFVTGGNWKADKLAPRAGGYLLFQCSETGPH